MANIVEVFAREILDSRGNPTLEVELESDEGIRVRAAVPSGASTGAFEACELRDGDNRRFGGRGVQKAVNNVNKIIASEIIGYDVSEQKRLDRILCELDGTTDKSHLGANAILGVSLAIAKAAARSSGLPLYRYIGGVNAGKMPIPLMNILNGGCHSDNNLDLQEFMIVPLGAPSFAEALRWGTEVFHALKSVLKKAGYSTSVGDEGGYAPNFSSNQAALGMIVKAIEEIGLKPGHEIGIAIDAASGEFWNAARERGEKGKYLFPKSGVVKTSTELLDFWSELISEYPILSLEDGMAENDWDGWQQLTQLLGSQIQLVGDDLFVTNIERLRKGIELNAANAVLIKPNQIGTLTETLATVEMAHNAGYKTIISHRSGETDDTTIADIAVAFNCSQIKAGAPSRGERVAKYNQLLRIEESLRESAIFDFKYR